MEGPTPEELKRVRETLRKDRTLAGLRDAAIIALLENPMLRASEVVGLDVRDVDLPKKDRNDRWQGPGGAGNSAHAASDGRGRGGLD